jgi:hypothetical protein
VARRIGRMLATTDRSAVASARLWLKVFTSWDCSKLSAAQM